VTADEIPAGADARVRIPSDRPLVAAQDLIRVYRSGTVETIALRGVDLEISEGEFVALMGRSGSGKSTLLNLLAGSDRPTAGHVFLDGIDLAQAPEPERAALRGRIVGIVYQSANLVPFLSLAENIQLSAALAGRRFTPNDVKPLLAAVGLADLTAHRPSQVSGGEQQRASLATVIAACPRLLLGDEITGELDHAATIELLDVLDSLRAATGLAVVLATHDRDVAARADRIVHLRDGRVAPAAAAA
jgi:putative ABC transport system ATP-binding protein